MSTAIYRGSEDGSAKERFAIYPDVNLSGPLTFCSTSNRLFFVDGKSVKYIDPKRRNDVVELFSCGGPISSIQLVPNSVLYTVSGVPGVRRFLFDEGERSVFLPDSGAQLASSYSTKYSKPGPHSFILLVYYAFTLNFFTKSLLCMSGLIERMGQENYKSFH